MKDYRQLPERLCALLIKVKQEKGLHQKDIAALCRVHPSMITLYKTGRRIPPITVISRLNKALGGELI